MKTNQPQLPTMPTDFSQPITVRGNELAAVIAEAQAAGYHAHRMKVSSQALYELQFFRLAGTAEAGNKIKESPRTQIGAKDFEHSCQFLNINQKLTGQQHYEKKITET